MSHHGKLRENKRCESCGHFVESRFCPECGQENIETRQPFHYLFTISVEDFVHYDGRFWKTITYLLFRPARLTKVYLSGKRNHYVPPVTLYIFISFLTFFVPSLLPVKNGDAAYIVNIKNNNNNEDETPRSITNKTEDEDSEQGDLSKSKEKDNNYLEINGKKFNTDELKKGLQERLIHNFPKAIFLYMPIFAFWLWLFHNKKKWYYFDHGIFTLHYFSFILLSILLYILLHWSDSYFDLEKIKWIKTIGVLFSIVFFSYFVYYFFHSHRLVYQERKAISRIKCSFLLFLNTFCMIIFFLSFLFIEIYFTDRTFFMEIIKQIH